MENSVNQSIEPRCICLESKQKNSLLHYGRFAVFPFPSGQASFLGTYIRRALLAEIEGLSIICVRFISTVRYSTSKGREGRIDSLHEIFHEYSTLEGIRESVHDILLNLRDVVLKGDVEELPMGSISFMGPGTMTAGHIQLPPGVQVVDKTQHIAYIEEPVRINIELLIQRGKQYQTRGNVETANSTFYIDTKLTPINNVNFNIYLLGEEPLCQELMLLEISTNGALTPEEAIFKAKDSLIWRLQPFSRITYK